MKILTYVLTLLIGIRVGFKINSSIHSSRKDAAVPDATMEIKSPDKAPLHLDSSAHKIQSKPVVVSASQVLSESKPRDISIMKDSFDQLVDNDEVEKARELLGEIKSRDGNSRQFLEGDSRLLVRTRDYEKAKESLKNCLAAYPNSKSCLIDMASVELQVGSKEEQDRAATNCATAMPADPQCKNMLAITKMNHGKYGDAVNLYEDLLKQNGGYGTRFPESILHSQLGYALQGANRLEEAVAHFDIACREKMADACRQAEEIRRQ